MQPRHLRVLAAAIFSLLLIPVLCAAEGASNWPQWRGPEEMGSTTNGAYPAKFDANTNVLWKAALPGKGCSTPIVFNRKIYLTAPSEGLDALLAYDWDGKQLWQSTVSADRPGKSNNGSGCNPSPATDGEHLFAYFKSGALAGFDLDGKLRWKTNLQERFGRDTLYWDIGTSPVLTDKNVVIAVMHHGGSYIAAFDKLSGEMKWKVSRDYETPVECDHSYATPVLYPVDGKPQLVVWGAEHLSGYDPADGKLLWSVGGFNAKQHHNWVCVASAVMAGNVAVIPYGRGAELHGIKLGGSGDMTASAHLWMTKDAASFVPTPAVYKGRVYVLRDHGEIECVDPAGGRIEWSGALPKKGAAYYSSPTVADGKLYAAREDGVLFVAKIEGGFELLSQNDMGERIIAAPVPVENRLFIRGESHLFCIGGADGAGK
ncbi:MAG TPA: PQQ-binding-like beta-propeller repeat protein [Tepidisphaeraceae bacterium]|jgi:outer membrane protein assembly factor BamB|nr:PQQ-binding-like beta-propeller repeat protein [Tepidisphaeraceae bacterium]